MTDRRLLANHIQSLEGDHVKEIVLEWLMGTEGSLDDFGQLLEFNSAETDDDNLSYGDLDERGAFQPLTESEMAAKSFQVLEEYKRTRKGVPHEHVREWLDSVGTDNPLPCPQ